MRLTQSAKLKSPIWTAKVRIERGSGTGALSIGAAFAENGTLQ